MRKAHDEGYPRAKMYFYSTWNQICVTRKLLIKNFFTFFI